MSNTNNTQNSRSAAAAAAAAAATATAAACAGILGCTAAAGGMYELGQPMGCRSGSLAMLRSILHIAIVIFLHGVDHAPTHGKLAFFCCFLFREILPIRVQQSSTLAAVLQGGAIQRRSKAGSMCQFEHRYSNTGGSWRALTFVRCSEAAVAAEDVTRLWRIQQSPARRAEWPRHLRFRGATYPSLVPLGTPSYCCPIRELTDGQ